MRKWLFWTGAGAAMLAVGGLVVLVGLDSADKISSVVAAVCGFVGLILSGYGLRLARDSVRPRSRPDESAWPVSTPDVPNQAEVPVTPSEFAAETSNVEAEWYFDRERNDVDLFGLIGLRLGDTTEIASQWRANEDMPLRLDLGIDRQGERLSLNVAADGPFGVLVGPTAAGKTELFRTMCASIIANYSPARARLHLMDLKGGIFWSDFEDAPHVVRSRLSDYEEFRGRLGEILSLIEVKLAALAAVGAKDIGDYNHKVAKSDKLPIDLVFVDEFRPDDWVIDEHMAKIMRMGRAVGLAVVVGIQRPDQLSSQIEPFMQFYVIMGHPSYMRHHWVGRRGLEFLGNKSDVRGRPQAGKGMLFLEESEVRSFQSAITRSTNRMHPDSPFAQAPRLDELVKMTRIVASQEMLLD